MFNDRGSTHDYTAPKHPKALTNSLKMDMEKREIPLIKENVERM